jgi:hypothetical protein
MRENSGAGDARTQTRDPTLQDNDDQGVPGRRDGDQTEGGDFAIGSDGAASPSSRKRGEVSGSDAASTTDG